MKIFAGKDIEDPEFSRLRAISAAYGISLVRGRGITGFFHRAKVQTPEVLDKYNIVISVLHNIYKHLRALQRLQK